MRQKNRLPREKLIPYLVEATNPPSRIDWLAIFGNNNPIEIEIGFGKGLFLINNSQANSNINFIGIEIARKLQLHVANRIAKRSLGNVRLVCCDGLAFLNNCVAGASCSAVHVYFPDPWWKRKHLKRRLVNAEFVAAAARSLRGNGKLHFATDVEEYNKLALRAFATEPSLALLDTPQPRTPNHDLDYLTSFERKFRLQGKPIYRAIYEKKLPSTQDVSNRD